MNWQTSPAMTFQQNYVSMTFTKRKDFYSACKSFYKKILVCAEGYLLVTLDSRFLSQRVSLLLSWNMCCLKTLSISLWAVICQICTVLKTARVVVTVIKRRHVVVKHPKVSVRLNVILRTPPSGEDGKLHFSFCHTSRV